MLVTKNKIQEIINREIKRYLKEEVSRKEIFPHYQLLKVYDEFLNTLELKNLNQETLEKSRNMKMFFEKNNTAEFLVDALSFNEKEVGRLMSPIYMMDKLGNWSSHKIVAMIDGAKKLVVSMKKKIKSIITGEPEEKDTPEPADNMDPDDKSTKNMRTFREAAVYNMALVTEAMEAMEVEEAAEDLPQLGIREPDKRLEKNKLKNKRKAYGAARKKDFSAADKLDEIFGLGGKSPLEKARAKYERFNKWAERAAEEGNYDKEKTWKKMANQWRTKAEKLETSNEQ